MAICISHNRFQAAKNQRGDADIEERENSIIATNISIHLQHCKIHQLKHGQVPTQPGVVSW